jgi:hypothetical protein
MSFTGRTTITSSAPCLFAYFPTGPTPLYKPSLCPFTSYYRITNFGYTYTHVRLPSLSPRHQRIRRFPRFPLSPTIPVPHPLTSWTSPHSSPPRLRSFTHLRSVSFPESLHHTPTKLIPERARSLSFTSSGRRGGPPCGRTTNISHGSAPGALASESPGLASGDRDPFDLPPADSALDTARSPLRLRGVNGDARIAVE